MSKWSFVIFPAIGHFAALYLCWLADGEYVFSSNNASLIGWFSLVGLVVAALMSVNSD